MLSSSLFALASAVGAAASPVMQSIVLPAPTCTNLGSYFCVLRGNEGALSYLNREAGNYEVSWSQVDHFMVGKGWSVGSVRNITYNSTWNGYSGDNWLSIYGWTRNPLIEYFVVETFGTLSPALGTQKVGTVVSDGGMYDFYKAQRVDEVTNMSWTQYYSVRQQKRLRGSVNLQSHFNAWAAAGMRLGTFGYQLLAVEGYSSSGSASVQIITTQ